jgi:hypothetical protein
MNTECSPEAASVRENKNPSAFQFKGKHIERVSYHPFSFFSIIMSDAIGILLAKPLQTNLIKRYIVNEATEILMTVEFRGP